jgi:hypothetical protein
VTPGQYRRIRWAVRAVLLLGVAASVTANVLHARPTPVAQAIAAWPPCALLLTVELISRIPVHRRGLAAVRIVATAVIAGIAAWVSYWHMAGVAARYGESSDAAHLIPFSVDGLVVVASVCLVELGSKISDLASRIDEGPAPTRTPEADEVVLPPHTPAPVLVTPVPEVEPLPEAPAEASPSATRRKSRPDSRPTSAPRRSGETTRRMCAALDADGMTTAQIAAAVGITERAVRAALKPVPVDGGER